LLHVGVAIVRRARSIERPVAAADLEEWPVVEAEAGVYRRVASVQVHLRERASRRVDCGAVGVGAREWVLLGSGDEEAAAVERLWPRVAAHLVRVRVRVRVSVSVRLRLRLRLKLGAWGLGLGLGA
jgi:hypothetical protein